MAEVEPIIQPDCVADNFWWKPVTFVDIHPDIIHIRELSCQYRHWDTRDIPAAIFTLVCSSRKERLSEMSLVPQRELL